MLRSTLVNITDSVAADTGMPEDVAAKLHAVVSDPSVKAVARGTFEYIPLRGAAEPPCGCPMVLAGYHAGGTVWLDPRLAAATEDHPGLPREPLGDRFTNEWDERMLAAAVDDIPVEEAEDEMPPFHNYRNVIMIEEDS